MRSLTQVQAFLSAGLVQAFEPHRRPHRYHHDAPVSRPAAHDLGGGGHVPMPGDARTADQGCVSRIPRVPASWRVTGRLAVV